MKSTLSQLKPSQIASPRQALAIGGAERARRNFLENTHKPRGGRLPGGAPVCAAEAVRAGSQEMEFLNSTLSQLRPSQIASPRRALAIRPAHGSNKAMEHGQKAIVLKISCGTLPAGRTAECSAGTQGRFLLPQLAKQIPTRIAPPRRDLAIRPAHGTNGAYSKNLPEVERTDRGRAMRGPHLYRFRGKTQ